jgi:hypothetical protein
MAESDRSGRWLMLAHQLPAHPSNLRVRIWRRLQQVGAIVLRNALYVLPANDEAREDFNWVREEIVTAGGEVSVFETASLDGHTDAELVRQFRKARTADYEALAAQIRGIREQMSKRARRRGTADRERTLRGLRERFTVIQRRDHFAAAGRAVVEQALRDLESTQPAASGAVASPTLRRRGFLGRIWVTRPRPGIDRLASAWLIRRFIASDARFAFQERERPLRAGHVPFDMPDVEFGHHGTECTFETLMRRFAIKEAGVVALSRIVHDLDLKENRYAMPEALAIGRLVVGLRMAYADDRDLLEHGVVVMEALYQSFEAERTRRRHSRKKR